MQNTENKILEVLNKVFYPDQNKSLVELRMVENIKHDNDKISFDLILPNANNPFRNSLIKACTEVLQIYVQPGVVVDINFKTKINPDSIKPKLEENLLAGIKNIIAISSGKGGVGKSTVSSNLAVALAATGAKVGVIDADIYGPSIPKMFGLEGAQPQMIQYGTKERIVPLERYNVKVQSIGFYYKADDALVWRGPMATGAVKQLLQETIWEELDYLLIDLPPGTSDIHLTLVQTVPITGAIIVSTPQNVALADVTRGINMFRSDKINVPILGLIENMAWFTPAELPENKYYIFGKDGCKNLAESQNIPLLGQIPLVQSICENSDQGKPASMDSNPVVYQAFVDLAERVIEEIEKRNQNLAPTKKVAITHS